MASTDYKEAFKLYDRRGNGLVPLEDLGNLLRACGQNPSLKEITELEGNVRQDFDFDTFSKILNRPGGFAEPLPLDNYLEAFAAFDTDGTGKIPWGKVRYVLGSAGEHMSDDELNELGRTLGIDPNSNEPVNLADMVNTIISN